MAGESEITDIFLSVKNALKGDFDLIRPNQCQPPLVDETVLMQHTEDQLDTSILDTDTDGYNTAHSDYDEGGNSDAELDSFLRAEYLINTLPDDDLNYTLPARFVDKIQQPSNPIEVKLSVMRTNSNASTPTGSGNDTLITVKRSASNFHQSQNRIPKLPKSTSDTSIRTSKLPEKTMDKLFFRNAEGLLKRFQSSVNWVYPTGNDVNSHKYLDCAAQISTKDITVTETTIANTITAQTSKQLKSEVVFKGSEETESSATNDIIDKTECPVNESCNVVRELCSTCLSTTQTHTESWCCQSSCKCREVS